ncbi:MAG: hypothetical protein SFY96_05415 [Planctomycetota bacterium]|nr:hypothetical protein [Planctomycetota bacterium]
MTWRNHTWTLGVLGLMAMSGVAAAQPKAEPGAGGGSAPAAGAAATEQAAESVAVLRGGRGEQLGVVAVSVDGVSVGELVAGVSSARMLSWHQVRSVRGTLADAARQYEKTSDAAWRGIARLDRGDDVGAESVLEPLAKTYQMRGGPTACAVFAGLLRCRLARGAQTLAVESWTDWMIAGEVAPDAGKGPGVSSFDRAESVLAGTMDATTGLVTTLPPVWLGVPAVKALAGAEAMPPEAGPGRAQQLKDLYVQAARFESGLSTRLPALDTTWSDAQRLVWQVVAARIGDDATRREARAGLAARLKGAIPAWQDAWCRVGLGRSLILEQDDEQKREGLLHLLMLAAREDGSDVYLTGVAIAEAAATMAARGDSAGATVVLADLSRRYPDHPAMEWSVIKPLIRGASAMPRAAPREERAAESAAQKDAKTGSEK